MIQTEFEFTLPKGFVDTDGNVHRSGAMRLSNAADEITPMKDPRVQKNKAYMVIILLSRVIVRLGDITEITPEMIEQIFSADLEFLQAFYQQINGTGRLSVPAKCPDCGHKYDLETFPLGER